MKKLLGLLTVLAFSATAFATPPEGDYNSKGFWKGSDGTKGEWSSVMTIKHTTDGFSVKEAMTINLPDGKTEKFDDESTVKTTKDSAFFEIQKNGAKVGTGYCGIKQCHMEGEHNGEKWEETLTMHKNKTYRLGSHVSKDMTVMWQGVMKKAKVKKAKKACEADCGCGDKCECTDCACEACPADATKPVNPAPTPAS